MFRIKRRFSEDGLDEAHSEVEAIVALPLNMFYYTGIAT